MTEQEKLAKLNTVISIVTYLSHPLTSQAPSPFVFALDSCQADGLLALLLIVITVRLQVTAAKASLVLLLPHPPLLGLPADGSSQPLLLFLPRGTPVGDMLSAGFKFNIYSLAGHHKHTVVITRGIRNFI